MRSARKRLRVVVDTNLFVSGTIIKRGHPFDLLEAWRRGLFTLLLSEEQRQELAEVLHTTEIKTRYSLFLDEIAALLQLLHTTASKVPLRRRLPVEVRDKKDEKVLAAALGGKADYLVTGDDDLLVLRGNPRLGNLKIVTVKELLNELR